MIWTPMSIGSGQTTGDIYRLHAYAHRKSYWTGKASWALHRHTMIIARGYAPTLAAARKAAEKALQEAEQRTLLDRITVECWGCLLIEEHVDPHGSAAWTMQELTAWQAATGWGADDKGRMLCPTCAASR